MCVVIANFSGGLLRDKKADDDVGILRELRDNCTCPICQELYSSSGGRMRPKLLPGCCHTLCEKCADQLCRAAGSHVPCCPLCRTHFAVPKGGVSKLPDNLDALRSLAVIAQWRRSSCRRHPGAMEDLVCLSCRELTCANCYAVDHARHEVTSVEVAAERMRSQLQRRLDVADCLDARLARAAVAVELLETRVREVQRGVLAVEKDRVARIQNDGAALLERLHNRLHPVKSDVEDGRKSLSEVFRRCRAIASDARELVRQIPGVETELERLGQLTDGINVDDIEQQRVEFTPFCLSDWIPLETVNLVGRLSPPLTAADEKGGQPTAKELVAQLDAARERESALRVKLDEMHKRQRIVDENLAEVTAQSRRREAAMAERDGELCCRVELLRAELSRRQDSDRVASEKTELERRMADQQQRFEEAARRISELETQPEELRAQVTGVLQPVSGVFFSTRNNVTILRFVLK